MVPPIARAREAQITRPRPARPASAGEPPGARRASPRRGRPVPRSRTSSRTRPASVGLRLGGQLEGRAAGRGARRVLEEVHEDLDRRARDPRGRRESRRRPSRRPFVRARTSGSASSVARKRSAGGRRLRVAARRRPRRGAPSRGDCRSGARASPSRRRPRARPPSRRPRRVRRRRSRPSWIAVIGVLRSCETARSSDVLSASLSRSASRCVRSSRNFSRSTASATSRPTDARAWRSARVPRTRRTPLERPPSDEREVGVPRAVSGGHLRRLAAPDDALEKRVRPVEPVVSRRDDDVPAAGHPG